MLVVYSASEQQTKIVNRLELENLSLSKLNMLYDI